MLLSILCTYFLPFLGCLLALLFLSPYGVGELSVFCQSYFNKTLIGQAGRIGGKARQEVEVEQRDWEHSGKQEAPSALLRRPLKR